jgi:hypothetical protein
MSSVMVYTNTRHLCDLIEPVVYKYHELRFHQTKTHRLLLVHMLMDDLRNPLFVGRDGVFQLQHSVAHRYFQDTLCLDKIQAYHLWWDLYYQINKGLCRQTGWFVYRCLTSGAACVFQLSPL